MAAENGVARNEKLALFDVDGTLTVPRKARFLPGHSIPCGSLTQFSVEMFTLGYILIDFIIGCKQ